MKRQIIQLVIFLLCLISSLKVSGQVEQTGLLKDEKDLTERISLFTSLRSLDDEAKKLNASTAQAFAKAEIAAAAWKVDQDWAKKLLREAYNLSLPPEEEREKLRKRPVGSAPVEPKQADLDRFRVRSKILQTARQDPKFANELNAIAEKELGQIEKAENYNSLALQALRAGDLEKSQQYIASSFKAEPTSSIGWSIMQLAAEDREAADRLILQYIQHLKTFPLTPDNAGQAYFWLQAAVFPTQFLDFNQNRQIAPAGVEASRAFIYFVIESMTALERSQPGSMKANRYHLLKLWLPLNQFAPELRGHFLILEQATRAAGEPAADLSLRDSEEKERENYEEQIEKATKSRETNELIAAIKQAIYKKDFPTARKLVFFLKDEAKQADFAEQINALEAIELANKGDIYEAQKLTEKLTQPAFILQTYPIVIKQCAKGQNNSCAYSLTYEALRKLKKLDNPAALPRFLSELTNAIAQTDANLAFEVLEEFVKAINRVEDDGENIRLGFDVSVFKTLVEKNEPRTFQLAESINKRFPRVVVLSSLYEWKSDKLPKPKKEKRT